MMIRFTWIGLVLALACSGCAVPSGSDVGGSLPVSMNVQRAVLNSGGQVATAALLDRTPLDQVDRKIADTKAIVAEVRKLLETGQIGDITLGQLQSALNRIVPLEYSIYSNQVLAAVSAFVTVPTDRLGKNNILRVREVLDGIELRCNVYDKTARISDRGVTPQLRVNNEAVKVIVR
jgi:hypothetical protein